MVRIIKKKIEGGFYNSPVFSEYFGNMNIAVADIETTGLSPGNSAVILGGAVIPDESEPESRLAVQYFADSVDDEEELLELYVSLLCRYDCIITYNGIQFDIPFLKKRMERHRMESGGMDEIYSLDMYRILKKYSELPRILPNMKQKTVESFVTGSHIRTDTIDGALSVELYYRYVTSDYDERDHLLDMILLHHFDDIVMLSEILSLFRKTDIHAAMYGMGFPVKIGTDLFYIIDSVKLMKRSLRAEGRLFGNAAPFMYYGDDINVEITTGNGPDRTLFFNTEIFCKTVKADGEYLVADLKRLELDVAEFESLAGYESGYLILGYKTKEKKTINHREINKLLRKELLWISDKKRWS